jgi:hypothetical protein
LLLSTFSCGFVASVWGGEPGARSTGESPT